jgi:hypothetical protein
VEAPLPPKDQSLKKPASMSFSEKLDALPPPSSPESFSLFVSTVTLHLLQLPPQVPAARLQLQLLPATAFCSPQSSWAARALAGRAAPVEQGTPPGGAWSSARAARRRAASSSARAASPSSRVARTREPPPPGPASLRLGQPQDRLRAQDPPAGCAAPPGALFLLVLTVLLKR